jgi:hypothetical protein
MAALERHVAANIAAAIVKEDFMLSLSGAFTREDYDVKDSGGRQMRKDFRGSGCPTTRLGLGPNYCGLMTMGAGIPTA